MLFSHFFDNRLQIQDVSRSFHTQIRFSASILKIQFDIKNLSPGFKFQGLGKSGAQQRSPASSLAAIECEDLSAPSLKTQLFFFFWRFFKSCKHNRQLVL